MACQRVASGKCVAKEQVVATCPISLQRGQLMAVDVFDDCLGVQFVAESVEVGTDPVVKLELPDSSPPPATLSGTVFFFLPFDLAAADFSRRLG